MDQRPVVWVCLQCGYEQAIVANTRDKPAWAVMLDEIREMTRP